MALKINSSGIRKSLQSSSKKSISKLSPNRLLRIGKAIMSYARNINKRSKALQEPFKELQSWGNTDYNFNNYKNEYNNAYDYNNYKIVRDNIHKTKSNLGNKKPLNKSVKTPLKPMDNTEDISCFSRPGFHANIKQYLLKTTLHGLRYIGDGHLSLIERVFWFIAVFMAVIMAGYFIGNIYEHWDSDPMIVSLNPEQAQITSIPFPAITICNMNLVRKSVADKILTNGSSVDKKILEGLCNINNDSAKLDIDSKKAGEWSYFKTLLVNVAQPCPAMLKSCLWKTESRSCESLFNVALTDEGLCCTFNSVHRELMFRNPRDLSYLNVTYPFHAIDWTPEDGYPSDSPLDGFPWRPIGSGANLGLTLVLDADIDEYYCSSTSGVGFKMLLHNPAETPKIADFGDLISPGQEIRIAVQPRIYDAQKQLRNIALKKRKCYFANEKKLVYYRTYTKKNCVMECEARLTIEKCNCSQYFMPKNASIRICGMTDAKCYVGLKIAIEDKLGINESATMLNTNCDDCFPACSELSYGKKVSAGLLTKDFQIPEEKLAGKSLEYFVNNMAVIHIYFLDTSFIRYTKGELFGFTDFLSNTGGLLGLFLGFSFLSLVEIIYFLSLRVICAFYRQNYTRTGGTVFPFSQ